MLYFKRAKVVEEPASPAKSAAQAEAEKAISRGERIRKLAEEAEMWRSFTSECVSGRFVAEMSSYDYTRPRLSLRMDEDTAILWRAFANQMAEERERRLKEILGV